MNDKLKVKGMIFLFFFSIGMWFLYKGCNLNLENACLSRKLEYSIVESSYITTGMMHGGKMYATNIYFIYNNITCKYGNGHLGDSDGAYDEINKYYIGKECEILVDKNDPKSCSPNKKYYYNYWVVGVLFLCISGFIIILNIIFFKKENNYDTIV